MTSDSAGERGREPETRDRFARAKAIFCAAIDIPEAARPAFLAEACGRDGALRQEVASLLASDGQASGFIEMPAAGLLAAHSSGTGDSASAVATGASTSAERAPQLLPETRLGAYLIEGLLGTGGMGEVYRARDARLRRKVAIKIVGSGKSSARADAALLREARHASALNHPGICGIYEVGDADGRPFIAMEFVEGETLRARVARSGRLDVADVLRYGACIADALDHAHRRGVIHRDLKSANVMIGADDQPTVLDFGLSRWMPDVAGPQESASFATETLALAGTLNYMAPELLLGGAADIRSDVWSLGILLFEMAVGEPPFKRNSTFETAASILRAALPPLPHGVPLGLRLVIERCLARDPRRRYQRAGDVLAALLALQHAGRGRRRLVAGLVARQLKSSRAIRFLAGAAAAGAAGVAALAAGFWWASPTPAVPVPAMRTLAVLPLANASGDDGDRYFVDGITEALIADIGETGLERVISRTTAMRFRDAQTPQPVVARELGVDAIVEGTVTRTPGRVSVSLRLRNGETGRVVWTGTEECPSREVQALVSRMAAGVAGGLHHPIAESAVRQPSGLRSVDPDVYEAYLKGRYYWYERTEASLRRAIEYYQSAIARDPTFAPAHAALADCYNQLGTMMVGTGSPAEYRPLAETSVIKALRIDPDLAEAHATLGYIRHYQWQWSESEREFVQALRLNPSNPLAHIWYANFLASRRHFQEAMREVRRALELDPFSLAVNTNVGWTLEYAGRREEAIAQFRRTLELDPGYAQAHLRLGDALADAGRFDEAVAEYRLTAQLTRESPASLGRLAEVYAKNGHRPDARALLGRLLRESRRHYVSPASISNVYEALGDVDEAFAWLDRAFQEHSNHLAYLAVDAHALLRRDPRYAALLRRVGLE